MRLYLVIDETSFYHPDFVAQFLRETRDEVVGAALVTKITSKNDINKYLIRHWYYLKFSEILKLATKDFFAKLWDVLLPKKKAGRFYSVKSVLKCFKITFIEVHNDINKKEYIEDIRSKAPDVIISSNSLYFGKNILDIPKYYCINRHSALLPSYGGLWPVFQAYVHGESCTGVSVHTMSQQIDSGNILAQKRIKIEKKDTIADLYEKCFDFSSEVILESLEKIRNSDFSAVPNDYQRSYYSFPTRGDWDLFREKGGKFV